MFTRWQKRTRLSHTSGSDFPFSETSKPLPFFGFRLKIQKLHKLISEIFNNAETREDVAEPSHEDEDLYVMADTKLSEFIEDEEQKFQFVFDPFNDRVFYLDVKELIPGEHLDAPVVSRSRGEAPRQVDELDLNFAAATTGSIFSEEESSEFYGDNDFMSDEFDPEGFEISDGREY